MAEQEERYETDLGDIEERARRMGWLPQEEFRGSADRWVDAETYVRNAETQLPLMKGTLSTMERKMAEQERLLREQSARIAAMQADFGEFVEFTRKSEERAYQRALKELQAKQRKAVEEQDLEAFDKASSELDEYIRQHPAITGKPREEKPPASREPEWFSKEVLENWKANNPWYLENPEMAIYARQIDEWLGNTRPELAQRERLEEVTRKVKEKYPAYWANPKRGGPQPVEGAEHGGRPASSRAGKTYADLPPDAKAICDRFCGKDGKGKTGTIPGYTREDYVRDYFREEAAI
jgi:hypothetical protein